jgi:hypothetical chaperone protein
VHLGGTDFDKTLSLAHLMPMLGYGGQLANGNAIPSAYYFNLATGIRLIWPTPRKSGANCRM